MVDKMNTANNNKQSTLIILTHIFIWVLLLHLVYNFGGMLQSAFIMLSGERFIDEAFLIIPSLIFLFYWNSNYLIPRLFHRKTWWQYIAAIVLSTAGLLALGIAIHGLFVSMGYESDTEDWIEFFDLSIIAHLVVVGISTSLGINRIARNQAAQKRIALQKQKETELNYLKAQVSPHFLFNTLNTIYAQAHEEHAEKTAENILMLSENMRYLVREADQTRVELSKEINFINRYIDLQRLRLADRIPISYTIHGKVASQKIAPLILIPFIENVFKHGVSYENAQPITIDITVSDQQIELRTSNAMHKNQSALPTGAGIENAKKLLNHLYPDQHTLSINRNNDKFLINLTLDF